MTSTGCSNRRTILRNVMTAGRGDMVSSRRNPASAINSVMPAASATCAQLTAVASHRMGESVTVGRPSHAAGASTTNLATGVANSIATSADSTTWSSRFTWTCKAPNDLSRGWSPESNPTRDAVPIVAACRLRNQYRFLTPLWLDWGTTTSQSKARVTTRS
jgi:hypothetical protein